MSDTINREALDSREPLLGLSETRTNTQDRIEAAADTDDIYAALDLLYPQAEVLQRTADFLDEVNFADIAQGRKWAVALFEGSDPRSMIAKRVETERFSTFFKTHPLKHYTDYSIYDDSSLFVAVIDTEHPEGPRPASALRIVRNSDKGFKSINSLASTDSEENPWVQDLEAVMGSNIVGNRAQLKLIIENALGMDRDASKTWAIESMAVLDEYAGRHGLVGEASFPLYAVCLQESNRAGINTWISIQDIKPLMQMQTLFNEPWQWLTLPPRAYDGPFPTIPASIPNMQEAQQVLRTADPDMGALLIDGDGLQDTYVMPTELQGAEYLEKIASK
jgi:hypothetical protein